MARDREALQRVYKHAEVNDIVMPPFFTQERYDSAQRNVPFADGDVVISTYPKSGTTWTQKIVHLLRYGEIPEGKKLIGQIPWHEVEADAMDVAALPTPRTWKSHLDWPMTYRVEGRDVRYVYVARNGKDVAVSLFHHARAWKGFEYDGDWDHWFELFMAGEVEFGHWARHVLGWWEVRERSDVLFLFYEDMLEDAPREVAKIAAFLGLDKSAQEIQEVADKCSFSVMKKDPQSNYHLYKSSFRKDGAADFIRKGEAGDWRRHFSEEQSARFDAMYEREVCARSDLRFRFDL